MIFFFFFFSQMIRSLVDSYILKNELDTNSNRIDYNSYCINRTILINLKSKILNFSRRKFKNFFQFQSISFLCIYKYIFKNFKIFQIYNENVNYLYIYRKKRLNHFVLGILFFFQFVDWNFQWSLAHACFRGDWLIKFRF